MRVLHVVGALDREIGGSATAAIHSAGYLRAQGVNAEVASTVAAPGADDYIAEAWPGLPVHAFPQRMPRHYRNSPGLRRWLRIEIPRADVVAVHGVFKIPFVDAATICRRHGVPYIVQPHSSLDPYDLRKHHQMKAIYGPLIVRRMLAGAATVLVTSQRERERLVTYGAHPDVEVLALAVPGPATEPRGERFRRRLGLGPEAEVVLFLSRIDPKKGIERLLAAAGRLRASRPSMVLVVVGGAEEPAYRDKLHRMASDLALGDRVIWAGLLLGEDKWDALAGADVFVLPSDYENFGIVVVEALLTDTPVLISDGVDLAGELQDAGGAFVCQPDVDSVVTGLSHILEHPAEAHASASAGHTFVNREYSPEAVTARTIDLYERVAATPKVAG